MSSLRWETKPNLRSPVLVAAFRGWNDGGSAATLAAAFLRTRLEATRFAVIDPDDYVDFQVTRPVVSLSDGLTRSIAWPARSGSRSPSGPTRSSCCRPWSAATPHRCCGSATGAATA